MYNVVNAVRKSYHCRYVDWGSRFSYDVTTL